MNETQNDSAKIAIWSLFASVLLGIGTHIATWAIDRHDVQNQKIEEDIAGKLDDFKSIMKVITEMRNVRFDIERECQFFPEKIHDKRFLMESSRRRNQAGYELVSASMMADFYFGPELWKKIAALNSWDASFTTAEVCMHKSPSDKDYEQKQVEIEILVKNLIHAEKQQVR